MNQLAKIASVIVGTVLLSLPSIAKANSSVHLRLVLEEDAFLHRQADGTPLSPSEPGLSKVETIVNRAWLGISESTNPLIFNWFDQIAAQEGSATYQLSLERVEVKYFNKISDDPWLPKTVTIFIRRRVRANVEQSWTDGGLYTASLVNSGSLLQQMEVDKVFRNAMFQVPIARNGYPCPALLLDIARLLQEKPRY